MKFCPVVPEICRGQVHGWSAERKEKEKEKEKENNNNKKKKKKQSKNNKSPKLCLLFGRLNNLLRIKRINEKQITESLYNFAVAFPYIFFFFTVNNKGNPVVGTRFGQLQGTFGQMR